MDRKQIINKLLNNRFFRKDGEFSKTSAILCATWAFVLFKYLFATCELDFMIPYFKIKMHWGIVFNWADAAAITSSASSLYYAVHNMGNKKEDVKEGFKEERREGDK